MEKNEKTMKLIQEQARQLAILKQAIKKIMYSSSTAIEAQRIAAEAVRELNDGNPSGL